jgi:hypothetical protein
MAASKPSVKYKQDPEDKLDYGWDWQKLPTPFLRPEETITTSTWAATDPSWTASSDLTLSASGHDTTTTVIWVKAASSSILGVYYVTNHIVTSEGREKDWSFQLTLEEE